MLFKKYNRSNSYVSQDRALSLRYKYIFTDHVMNPAYVTFEKLQSYLCVKFRIQNFTHIDEDDRVLQDFSCNIINGNSVVVTFR